MVRLMAVQWVLKNFNVPNKEVLLTATPLYFNDFAFEKLLTAVKLFAESWPIPLLLQPEQKLGFFISARVKFLKRCQETIPSNQF